MALSFAHKIETPFGIEKVKKEGKIYQSENFGVAVLKRSDSGVSKFAVVVSNKISKLAVNRNRIKRAITDALRINLKKAPEGYDILLETKRSILIKTTEEVVKEVKSFLEKTSFNNNFK